MFVQIRLCFLSHSLEVIFFDSTQHIGGFPSISDSLSAGSRCFVTTSRFPFIFRVLEVTHSQKRSNTTNETVG